MYVVPSVFLRGFGLVCVEMCFVWLLVCFRFFRTFQGIH